MRTKHQLCFGIGINLQQSRVFSLDGHDRDHGNGKPLSQVISREARETANRLAGRPVGRRSVSSGGTIKTPPHD
jgi:hypothetical protein